MVTLVGSLGALDDANGQWSPLGDQSVAHVAVLEGAQLQLTDQALQMTGRCSTDLVRRAENRANERGGGVWR